MTFIQTDFVLFALKKLIFLLYPPEYIQLFNPHTANQFSVLPETLRYCRH